MSIILDLKKVERAVDHALECLGGNEYDLKFCECETGETCDYCILHNALVLSKNALNQEYVVASGENKEAIFVNGNLSEKTLDISSVLTKIGFNIKHKEFSNSDRNVPRLMSKCEFFL